MKGNGRIYIIAGVALALVAGGLLFLYLRSLTDQASRQPTPTPIPNIDVVLITKDVQANTLLTADVLRRETRKANEVTGDPIREVSEAIDRMAEVEIKAGTILKRGDVSTIPIVVPKGKRAMAVFVDDQSSIAGLVRERDIVDIVVHTKIELGQSTRTPNNAPRQQPADEGSLVEPTDEQITVKAALQGVQVLKVIIPPAPQSAQARTNQPTPEIKPGTTPTPAPPQGRITKDQTIVVLAVNDQEAELLRYAKEAGGLQLILRGRDDPDKEETKGMTLDILIREYGLPVPKPVIVDLTPE
jgi:pilus assembly protein CpaB